MHPEGSFARAQARTGRFRYGAPGGFHLVADGSRAFFTRSNGPEDSVNSLWLLDLTKEHPRELRIIDPVSVSSSFDNLPPAEKARRERMRVSAAGVTGYSVSHDGTRVACALGGALVIAYQHGSSSRDLDTVPGTGPSSGRHARRRAEPGTGWHAAQIEVPGPVIDPRISPDGRHVAWVSDRSLFIGHLDVPEGSAAHESGRQSSRSAIDSPQIARVRQLVGSDTASVSWGLANFLAAEEFDRHRGFWWNPDSTGLIVERVDESPSPVWHLADPTEPWRPGSTVHYPAAGNHNPDVELWYVPLTSTSQVRIDLPEQSEYVVSVRWQPGRRALITTLNRPQDLSWICSWKPNEDHAQVEVELADAAWVEHVPGTPLWDSRGRLVHTHVDSGGTTSALAIDGARVDLLSRRVNGDEEPTYLRSVATAGDDLLVHASPDPAVQVAYSLTTEGLFSALTPAWHWSTVYQAGPARIIISHHLDSTDVDYRVVVEGHEPAEIQSLAATPPISPAPILLRASATRIPTAVLWPSPTVAVIEPLPVLLLPYGGPHGQRVVASGRAFAEAQWFADLGFCVIIADGRGTPGISSGWERAVSGNLADPALDDQIEVVNWASEAFADRVDVSRVGIMGWSFGGYLSALAVLKRPDVFHAAVAGAPVSDWRWYDSAYSERYLGHPDVHSDHYERSSLIPLASTLTQPLMIIHGLADDNVFAAHSLQLSAALSTAGHSHEFVPLSRVTHMATGPDIAEGLLSLQTRFLSRHLRPGGVALP